MKRRIRTPLFALLLCLVPPSTAAAEAPPTLAERMEMAFRYAGIPDRMPGLALLEPRWLADGNRFRYAAGAPQETVFYLVDPVANTRVELFGVERLGRELEEVPSPELRPLAPGGRWYRDWVGPYYAGRILGVPSPDGAWILEEEDHDLWLRSTRGEYVDNLEGHLLLAQATDDDIGEVMILVDALIDAGKPYDLLIMPEGGHSLAERHPRYFQEMRMRYLVEHLKPELPLCTP